MTLRAKVLAYLILLHVVLGVVALIALREHRTWLLAAEAAFLVSIVVGMRLVRAFFIPLDLIRTGADLIAERDFTTHFRDVGQSEMDELIRVYNRMIDQLREERLKTEEQQQFLGKLIDASPSGIMICDFDGAVATMNPAASRLAGSIDLSAIRRGESMVQSISGGRLVRVHHGEFYDRGFERSFYLVEELTEELRASEKAAYEQLIRMMSHEVNNSVGAVRSLLESSLNYAPQIADDDRPDFEKALRVSIGRIESLNQFVNGFADVVRLPAPFHSDCRLDELVGDIVTLMQPELEQCGITVRVDVAPGVTSIRADRNQIEQVLINVMKNAVESIGREGVIEIRLTRESGQQSLRIADTGAGIPPDAAPKLFSPFFSTKRDGRGLGLTLIHGVLAQHGFDYSLENRSEGGAEFRITFPLKVSEEISQHQNEKESPKR